MILGFTGTRHGMTPEQRLAVREFVTKLRPNRVVHGDCIGADYDFDNICAELKIPRGIRPSTIAHTRAHCEERGAEALAEPIAPLARDRLIVEDSTQMLGVPKLARQERRSGTWATLRYAVGKRPTHIIPPDGSVKEWAFVGDDYW